MCSCKILLCRAYSAFHFRTAKMFMESYLFEGKQISEEAVSQDWERNCQKAEFANLYTKVSSISFLFVLSSVCVIL